MAMNIGWKDQYQPLPVIPPVAMATSGVSGEGQRAAHLCLSLPVSCWIETSKCDLLSTHSCFSEITFGEHD